MQSVETDKFRVTNFLFIGILVCVPLLALYHFGFFPQTAVWLGARLPRLLVLPEDGVEPCRILQYSYYTGAAFISAWLGLSLRAIWQKLAFLLGFSYLTLGLTVALAWTGILFEPFSGIGAAWLACLGALVVADLGHSVARDETASASNASPTASVEDKTSPSAASAETALSVIPSTDSKAHPEALKPEKSETTTSEEVLSSPPTPTAKNSTGSLAAPAVTPKLGHKGKPGQGTKKLR